MRTHSPKSVSQATVSAIQPQLKVGKPNDMYEQEANQMADHVVGGTPSTSSPTMHAGAGGNEIQKMSEGGAPSVSRMSAGTGSVQKMSDNPMSSNTLGYASSELSSNILSTKGTGQKMAPDVRRGMEQQMGTDLSGVHIHTDSNAVALNESMGAKAFTNGKDVYFNQGQYDPASKQGQHLLAHELTHTVQQGGGGTDGPDIQCAFKYELQSSANKIWRSKGKEGGGPEPLPWKFGPSEAKYLHKQEKADDSARKAINKEGSGMELQADARGEVEFETPQWFRVWSELKDRLEAAYNMTVAMNGADLVPGTNRRKFPFDISHLYGEGGKGDENHLWADEELQVEIGDPNWFARIQASEGVSLNQYESIFNEHEYGYFRVPTVGKSIANLMADSKIAEHPEEQTQGLKNFLLMILDYTHRAQTYDQKGEYVKSTFSILMRTSFYSIYHTLLTELEQTLFQDVVARELIPKEVNLGNEDYLFKNGYGSSKHETGPKIGEWLNSIIEGVPTTRPNKDDKDVRREHFRWDSKKPAGATDMMSKPKGGSDAMGKFDVRSEGKAANLIRLEMRSTDRKFENPTLENSYQALLKKDPTAKKNDQPRDNWIAYARELFQYSVKNRERTETGTELIYDE